MHSCTFGQLPSRKLCCHAVQALLHTLYTFTYTLYTSPIKCQSTSPITALSCCCCPPQHPGFNPTALMSCSIHKFVTSSNISSARPSTAAGKKETNQQSQRLTTLGDNDRPIIRNKPNLHIKSTLRGAGAAVGTPLQRPNTCEGCCSDGYNFTTHDTHRHHQQLRSKPEHTATNTGRHCLCVCVCVPLCGRVGCGVLCWKGPHTLIPRACSCVPSTTGT
jgi:hypothetical protein